MSVLIVISFILILIGAYFYRKARPYLKYPLNVKNIPRIMFAMLFPSFFEDEGKTYCQYGLVFFIFSFIVYLVDLYI